MKLGFNFGLGGVSIAFRLTDGFGHAIDKITIAYANAIVSIAFRLTDGFGLGFNFELGGRQGDTVVSIAFRLTDGFGLYWISTDGTTLIRSQLPFGLLTDLDSLKDRIDETIKDGLNCLSAY